MQKVAQERGIFVLHAVAESLPIREGSFNFVLMVTTICFIENIISAFKEAFKILGSKGSLIVGFIDKNSYIGKLYRERKNKSVFYKNATFFTVKKVISYLKRTGFRTFELFQTIFHNVDLNIFQFHHMFFPYQNLVNLILFYNKREDLENLSGGLTA